MSLSEKLEIISNNNLTIAENQERVYKAGQSSMVDESKIIEKTVSGEYISVDDVSEIPHDVKVKLTSGGKNLFNEQFRQGNFENSSTNRISSTQSINIKSGILSLANTDKDNDISIMDVTQIQLFIAKRIPEL